MDEAGVETPAGDHLARRLRKHELLAARLSAMKDDHLAALLAEAPAWRNHIHGNQSTVVEIDDAKVFVKQVALTDLERDPSNEGSTANLFGLPTFYQYGVGSAGFGAWRELQAYLRAGRWVQNGECPHFPLLHHWRVMPRSGRPSLSAEQYAWLEQAPDYWNGSDAVRVRLGAIAGASATIVLFLEHAPETLDAWLTRQLTDQHMDDTAEATALRLHAQLHEAAAFMNARGMLHFDLHGHNVLTDGERAYVADFGLALCADFDLSADERAFFESHRLYDRCFVTWDFIERLTKKARPSGLPPLLRTLIERSAPVAGIFRDFFEKLSKESKTAPYPAAALEAAFAAQSAAR